MPERPCESFEELIKPHFDYLFRIAMRFTNKVEDAEDLLQDLLVKLYPRFEEIRQLEQPRSWFTKVLYRMYIDSTRKYARNPLQSIAIDQDSDDPNRCDALKGDTAREPDQQLQQAQLQARLLYYLGRLNREQRSLLVLHDVEGYSLPDLHAMLGIPLGTLKSRLHRARERMRKMIDDGTIS